MADKNFGGHVNQELSFDDLATLGTKHMIPYYHVRCYIDVTNKPNNLRKGNP
jgi:hypothetical protein